MAVIKSLAVAAVTLVSASQGARADWHYCLAPFQGAHKVYLSDPFAMVADTQAVQGMFEQVLVQEHLQHDLVQCPRADTEHQIGAMRDYAITFNRDFLDRAMVDLHWSPAVPVARRPASGVR